MDKEGLKLCRRCKSFRAEMYAEDKFDYFCEISYRENTQAFAKSFIEETPKNSENKIPLPISEFVIPQECPFRLEQLLTESGK